MEKINNDDDLIFDNTYSIDDELLWMDEYMPKDMKVTTLSFFQNTIQHWMHEPVLPEEFPALVFQLKQALTGFPVDTFNFCDFSEMMDLDVENGNVRSGRILCMKIAGPLTEIIKYIHNLQFSDATGIIYILQGIWNLTYTAQIEESLRAASYPQIPIIRSLVYEDTLHIPEVTLIIKIDPAEETVSKDVFRKQ